MLIIFYLFLIILIKHCESDVAYLKHPLKSCNVGDIIQNECNKCVCTSKAIFECTSLNCNNTKHLSEEEDTSTCHPNQLYVQNLISCICTKDGKWPHTSCHETFQSLPPKNVIAHKCEPDTYVVVDCNVCKCGPNGVILNSQCTKNVCDDDIRRSMTNKPSNVYGSCEINNWYSLAACQFCFCANENRLVCNTGNHYSKNLELGSYNLVVCGKELIKDALELIPNSETGLRYKDGNGIDKKTTKTALTKQSVQQMDINVKGNDKGASSDEYYTDTSEEETTMHTTKKSVPTPTATVKIISTQNPYQEGDETNNDNEYDTDKKEPDDDEDSSDETGVPIKQVPFLVPTVKPTENHKTQIKMSKLDAANSETLSAFGETLKINLPKVLNKVFQMALRKSMVSLNSETTCTPGTTSMKKCNMCFCLKNTKLLCTNNDCD